MQPSMNFELEPSTLASTVILFLNQFGFQHSLEIEVDDNWMHWVSDSYRLAGFNYVDFLNPEDYVCVLGSLFNELDVPVNVNYEYDTNIMSFTIDSI